MRIQPASNVSRQPRAIVMINDERVLWENIRMNTNSFYVADTFSLTIPLSDQTSVVNLDYLISQKLISVKIYIGFPPNADNYTTQDLELFMTGDATSLDIDPFNSVATIEGRDYSSRLIDTKTTRIYNNYTASAVANEFAKSNNLTPQVTNTTEKVGNIFYNQPSLVYNNMTQWDLLTYLAQLQNFITYVTADTLVFKPIPSSSNVSDPYVIPYTPRNLDFGSPISPTVNLSIRKTMALVNDVKVTVKVPYNPRTGQAFSVTLTSKHSNNASKGITKHVRSFPGLTPDQAKQRAQQLLNGFTLHETQLFADMAGDNLLKKDSLIKVTGFNNEIDQYYYVDEISRTINVSSGYSMTVMAKNRSPNAEVS